MVNIFNARYDNKGLSLEIQKKSRYLHYFTYVAFLFLLLVIGAHLAEQAGIYHLIGDFQALFFLLLSFYFLKTLRYRTATYIIMCSSLLMILFIYVIGDFESQVPIPELRLYETLVALMVLLLVISMFASNTIIIYIYLIVSLPVLVAHFIVFNRLRDFELSPHSYALLITGLLMFLLSIYTASRIVGLAGDLVRVAQQSLHEKSHMLDSIFQQINTGYSLQRIIYSNGRAVDSEILQINEKFSGTYNIDTHNIIGKKMSEVFPLSREYKVKWLRLLRDLKADKSARMNLFNKEMNKWANLQAFKIKKDQFILLYYDITSEMEAQEQLKSAKEKAEFANMQKSRFLANVSHEIRTPMNGILGLTNILSKTHLAPQQREYLELIQMSSESLLTVLNDILDLSKIQEDKIELHYEIFDLPQLIESIRKSFEFRLSESGVVFRSETDPTLPRFVFGDSNRLRQVLVNLYSNAIKFTTEGSITLTTVVKNIKDGKATFEFSLADTGTGIPEHTRERIFDSFTQADFSRTRQKGGTGLGLAICKKLIELMDGHIHVESEVGHGSNFIFDIKVSIPDEDDIKLFQSLDNEIQYTLADFSGMKILIAEDNFINQKYVSALLSNNGIKYNIAANGKEAVELFKSNTYDCILMDIQMPEMDGVEATQKIREIEAGDSHIPIIALTASAFIEEKEKFLKEGMDDYISKPVDESKLLDSLKHIKAEARADNHETEKQDTTMQNEKLINRETFDQMYAPMGAELVHEIIDIFMKEYPGRLEQFEKDITTKDMDNLARTAHSLKGVVSTMYAQPVVELCEKLVQKGRNNDPDGTAEMFEGLKSLLQQFVEELEELKEDYQ